MSLRVTNLRLSVDQSELELTDVVARRLKLKRDDLTRLRILRKSLDARSRDSLKFVYTVMAEPRDEAARRDRWEKLSGVEQLSLIHI